MRTIGLEEHFVTEELAGYGAGTATIAQPRVWAEASRRLLDDQRGGRDRATRGVGDGHRAAAWHRGLPHPPTRGMRWVSTTSGHAPGADGRAGTIRIGARSSSPARPATRSR